MNLAASSVVNAMLRSSLMRGACVAVAQHKDVFVSGNKDGTSLFPWIACKQPRVQKRTAQPRCAFASSKAGEHN